MKPDAVKQLDEAVAVMLIRHLNGRTELRGGSTQDRLAAQEWISLFWHEAVVGDGAGRRT